MYNVHSEQPPQQLTFSAIVRFYHISVQCLKCKLCKRSKVCLFVFER